MATSHYIHLVSMHLDSPSVNHVYLIMIHQELQEHHLMEEKTFGRFYCCCVVFFFKVMSGHGLFLNDFRELNRLQEGCHMHTFLNTVMELCLLKCSRNNSSGDAAPY